MSFICQWWFSTIQSPTSRANMESTNCLRFVGGQGCWGWGPTRGEEGWKTHHSTERWAKGFVVCFHLRFWNHHIFCWWIAIIMNRNFLNKMGSLELWWNRDMFIKWDPQTFQHHCNFSPFLWVGGYGQPTLQDPRHRRRVHRSKQHFRAGLSEDGLEVLRCPSSTFKSSNCLLLPVFFF